MAVSKERVIRSGEEVNIAMKIEGLRSLQF